MEEKNWYTYMLRCEDNSIYTGITTDMKRRETEHISKSEKCAKYTKKHQAIKIEIAWKSADRKLASKLEYFLKTLNKKQKEELIKTGKLEQFLKEKIECEKYEVENVK